MIAAAEGEALNVSRLITMALTLQWIFFVGAAAKTNPAKAPEQTTFSAENENVANPIPVPEGVLSLLSTDGLVREVMRNSDPPMTLPSQDWFSASQIHLGPPNEVDLIIQAKGPLSGGNVNTFWVFLDKPGGHILALTAPVHDLEVLKTRWNGYREIEVFSTTAIECTSVRLRFSGTRYQEYKSKSGPIPNC